MRILVVDDEGNIRRMLRALLEEEGWTVADVPSAEAGLTSLQEDPPEVILLDLALPGMSGLDALMPYQDAAPGTPIVMMSGEATLAHAVEATRRGAFHFIEKPLHPDALLITLRAALEVSRARDLSRALQRELGPTAELVGRSPALAAVLERIRRVAPTDARVLITGESGTGKELAATAIHGLSRRAGGPFVRVNSAAIPRELVESEMFGHEKGAFTGATERRRGRFELAHGGTLFLDEVADLALGAQAKLLRVLESGVVERVGGASPIPVDVRILAATNRDLREETREGRFRDDLFFRLEVVPLHMPALRERQDDIPLLVTHALERLRLRHGLPAPRITPEAMTALTLYRWPGNVRELMNIIERLAILHPGARVGEVDVARVLPEAGPGPTPESAGSLAGQLEAFERTLITNALTRAEGSVAEAGRLLRTDRANLYRRMRRLGIRDD